MDRSKEQERLIIESFASAIAGEGISDEGELMDAHREFLKDSEDEDE